MRTSLGGEVLLVCKGGFGDVEVQDNDPVFFSIITTDVRHLQLGTLEIPIVLIHLF